MIVLIYESSIYYIYDKYNTRYILYFTTNSSISILIDIQITYKLDYVRHYVRTLNLELSNLLLKAIHKI